MSISIIGAGNVGMALGQAFTQRGESVVYGVPEPAKYEDAVAALGHERGCGRPGGAAADDDDVAGIAGQVLRAGAGDHGRRLLEALRGESVRNRCGIRRVRGADGHP